MRSSILPLLRGTVIGILLLSSSCSLFAQNTRFENYSLEPVLGVGLFVDTGTDAFFRDIKVVTENQMALTIRYLHLRTGKLIA